MKRTFLGNIFLWVMIAFTACNTPENVDPNQNAVISSGSVETIASTALPAAVLNAINKDFAGQTITETLKETGSDGTVMYTVTMSSQSMASYNEAGNKGTEVTLTNLAQAIKDYVNNNFAGNTVSRAVSLPNSTNVNLTLVRLSGNQVLSFDAANNFLNGETDDNDDDDDDDDDDNDSDDNNCVEDSIAVSALPQAIRDYVATNYAGQTIQKAYKENCNGTIQYEVELSGGVELIFDANGQFIKKETDDDKNDNKNEVAINATDLPQATQTYISTNYAGKTITKAYKITDSTGIVTGYEVELNDGTEVYFDATGNFVKEEKDIEGTETAIAASELPQAVQTYISTNYAGKTITKAYKITNTAGTVIGYEVELSDGTEVYFDANGNFVKAEQD
ncbi:hypothetical protein BKI52_44870 [marine bacterium AO1-C]|nr:hypothetical protein BKI52_44870 [marine bacterium AO1-C]